MKKCKSSFVTRNEHYGLNKNSNEIYDITNNICVLEFSKPEIQCKCHKDCPYKESLLKRHFSQEIFVSKEVLKK